MKASPAIFKSTNNSFCISKILLALKFILSIPKLPTVFIVVSEFSDPLLKFILILCLKIFKDESKNQDPEKKKKRAEKQSIGRGLRIFDVMSLKETLL